MKKLAEKHVIIQWYRSTGAHLFQFSRKLALDPSTTPMLFPVITFSQVQDEFAETQLLTNKEIRQLSIIGRDARFFCSSMPPFLYTIFSSWIYVRLALFTY